MIDLHLHLDGSLNPDNILHMADMSKISLPYEDKDELYRQLKVSPYCSNLSEYLEKFVLPLQVLQTGECIEPYLIADSMVGIIARKVFDANV